MKREKSDRRLWHRLEGYSFHERPLSRSLIDRLGEETGHSVDVCYTLVEEYRRFMYLVGSTGETLAPSPIVDLVWRLHISDERAYFEDFCPRVIGRTIHHIPDAPPVEEDPAYERTLEYYAQEFGRPQVQYWPDPDVGAVTMSTALMWIVGVAAFALAVIFGSFLFAAFGAFVISGSAFLKWKFSSLPLHNLNPETE
ncbi:MULTISPECIES: glycine-rich domain-containing protein [unclassified Yoonia]|uniref:glycine-rich domain-containing protein n=1 Tax=unclassified Yoonia TaxID=2629118 RepID=UPI00372BF3D0